LKKSRYTPKLISYIVEVGILRNLHFVKGAPTVIFTLFFNGELSHEGININFFKVV